MDTANEGREAGKVYYCVIRGQEYEHVTEGEVTTTAILAGITETSTSHGFPQISNSPGHTKRVIWIVILLSMVAALVYNLEHITSKFFRYDVQASVYILNVNKQKFPAVTVCNMSPFKMSLVVDNEDISAILGVNRNIVRRKRETGSQSTGRSFQANSVQQSDKHIKKRKQKRYIATPTCDLSNYDAVTGTCYALATVTGLFGGSAVGNDVWESHLANCQTSNWDLAVLDTSEKFNFVSSRPAIFTPEASTDTYVTMYWLKLRYVGGAWRWGGEATDPLLTFAAWDTANGMPRDPIAYSCAYADVTNGHLWANGDCFDYIMALCQKPDELVAGTSQALETSHSTTYAETEPHTRRSSVLTTVSDEFTSLMRTDIRLTTTEDLSTSDGSISTSQSQISTSSERQILTSDITTNIRSTTEGPSTLEGSISTSQSQLYTYLWPILSSDGPITIADNIVTTSENQVAISLSDSQTIASDSEYQSSTVEPFVISSDNEMTTTFENNIATSSEGQLSTSQGQVPTFENPTTALHGQITTSESYNTIPQVYVTSSESFLATTDSHIITSDDQTTASEIRITTDDQETLLGTPETVIISSDNEMTTFENDRATSESQITTSQGQVPTFDSPTTAPQGLITISESYNTIPEVHVTSSEGVLAITDSHITTTDDHATTSDIYMTTDDRETSSKSGITKIITEDRITTSTSQSTAEIMSTSQSLITEFDLRTTLFTNQGQVETSTRQTSEVDTTTNQTVETTQIDTDETDACISCIVETSENSNGLHSATANPSINTDVNSNTTTATTTESRITTPYMEPYPDSSPVPGSVFPERIQQEEDFVSQSIIYESLSYIDDAVKQTVGFEADKFIIDCQFAGYPCYPWQFSYFYNNIHGNCYIFNSGWNNSENVKWSFHVGRRYALKVVLNIDQDEYVGKMGQAAGVRIAIHDQVKMPFPEDEGVMAQPGLLTSIGVQKMEIERKGNPYTKCIDAETSHLNYNVYEEHYPVKYTNLACYKTCFQRNVIEQCGCAFAGLPMKGKAFGDSRVYACNSSNIEQDDCLYNVSQFYAMNKLDCDCKDPCREEYYSTRVSHSRWPADNHIDGFLSSHKGLIYNLLNSTDQRKYENNLVKVEVYFETFDYEKIIEVASYKDLVFMSDVGGSFGLWVGWSFITVFEFVELVVDLLVQTCRRKRSRKENVSDVKHAENFISKLQSRKSLHLRRISRKRKERKRVIEKECLKAQFVSDNGTQRDLDSGLSSACSMETSLTDQTGGVLSPISNERGQHALYSYTNAEYSNSYS